MRWARPRPSVQLAVGEEPIERTDKNYHEPRVRKGSLPFPRALQRDEIALPVSDQDQGIQMLVHIADPFVVRLARFREGPGVGAAIGEIAAQHDVMPRFGCRGGIRRRRLHQVRDGLHIQAGLQRRGGLLRIRGRQRSAHDHALDGVRMPAGVVRGHRAVIRPSKQDHLSQLTMAPDQVQIFGFGFESRLSFVRHRAGVDAGRRTGVLPHRYKPFFVRNSIRSTTRQE